MRSLPTNPLWGGGYDGGHLGEYVADYIDGELPPEAAREAALHLLICENCRQEADSQRQISAAVRTVPVAAERQAHLMQGLMALGQLAAGCDEMHCGSSASTMRSGSHRVTRPEIAVIALEAPAQYDRHRRAPLLFVMAGATAVAGVAIISSVPSTSHTPSEVAPRTVVHQTRTSRQEPERVISLVDRVTPVNHALNHTVTHGSIPTKAAASGTIAP